MATDHGIRRLLAVTIGAIGLAYPACAAICPRGRSGCPYPGHCFLYTDADANSLCDYTSQSAAPTPAPSSAPDVVSPAALPAPSTDATTAVPTLLPSASGSNAVGLVPFSALVAGVIVFLVTAAALYLSLRSGRLGSRGLSKGSALALSALFSLGLAEVVTYLLAGPETPATGFAALYLVAGSALAAQAWRGGAVSRPVVLALSATGTLFGFVLLAPLMPAEFAGLVTAAASGGRALLAPGIVGVLAGLALALAAGRTFCGHVCPVGSIQELAYAAPTPKVVVGRPRYLEGVRLGAFIVSVFAGLSAVNLMAFTGVYDFFALTASIGLVVFAGLLALSAVVYRPVCRALCPFGLLFSLPAHVSRLRLRRTKACVDCGRCEKACPVGIAGRDASKRECYLCGRCVEACRVEGALAYSGREP